MTEAFRMIPALPVAAYKTYAISAPIQTHTRPATCEEVECAQWRMGWKTVIDLSTELGERQAKYIRLHSGRKYTLREALPMLELKFPPGQKCFAQHRIPLEREPLYVVRDGDWRGNPTGERRVHARGDHWVEDFAEHQDKINDQRGKG